MTIQSGMPATGRRPAVAVAVGGRVVGTSADLLWNVLTDACTRLGFGVLGDDGIRAMVPARTVELTSKADVVQQGRVGRRSKGGVGGSGAGGRDRRP